MTEDSKQAIILERIASRLMSICKAIKMQDVNYRLEKKS